MSQTGDEQGNSQMKLVSDALSSPNDGLNLSNIRASLNTKKRAREKQERM